MTSGRRRAKLLSERFRPPTLLFNRERELALLRQAFADAADGRGQVVLLIGEPGIGKTRLAEEFARLTRRHGARVVWARAIDHGASPRHWLWSQAVRGFADVHAAPRTIRSDSAPFRVARTIVTLLERACRLSPVVLVLDDLQWADPGSLVVLEVAAQEAQHLPVLILGTCRAGEHSTAASDTAVELARLGRRVGLGRLSQQSTTRVLASISGRSPTHGFARAVHGRTGGNPFFVAEIARLNARNPLAIPDSVREVVDKQRRRLSGLANEVLNVASVIGRDFDFSLLQETLRGAGEPDLLGAIDEGLRALLLEPLPRIDVERYRFRYALIHEAIYSQLSPSRRARWHAAVAEALERCGDAPENRALEISQHAARAGVRARPDLVLRCSFGAGRQLLDAHDFTGALLQFERARTIRGEGPLDAAGAAILAGLGKAQAASSVRWSRQQAWLTVVPAIEHYLERGDVSAAVALATEPCFTNEGTLNAAAVIERIRDRVARGSLEEGRLLARLGAAVYFEHGDYAAAHGAFGHALGVSGAEGTAGVELRTLAYAAAVDHFHLRWPEVVARSHRVQELARRAIDPHSEAYARYRTAYALMQTGSAAEADAEARENAAVAERLRDHGLLADALYIGSTLAQMRGNWEEARACSDRGLHLSPQQLPLLHARVLLEYETGHQRAGDRYLTRLRTADTLDSPYPLAGAFVAIGLAQSANLSGPPAADGESLRAASAVLTRRPSIPNAVATVRVARALVHLRRSHLAECEDELDFLTPYEGLILAPCLVTARLLGRLAIRVGRTRRAFAHFEAALAFCRRGGYLPELAWTCLDYARALLDAGGRGDRQRAGELVTEAADLAAHLGLRPVANALSRLRHTHGLPLQRNPSGLTGRELEILRLLSQGRTNRQIADALSISINTVAVHVARVLHKTGASNRTGAAAYAVRHNLIAASLV